MIEIDVTDYRRLAFKHINALPPYRREGVEEADLLNAAYIGIHLASKKFDESLGKKFESFCYWYIQREINLLTARQTVIDGKSTLVKRVQEPLFDDVVTEDISIDESSYNVTDDYKEEEIYVSKFLDTLPLEGIERNFFLDMHKFDETTASKNYQAMTGNTRARAEQVKKIVKAKAARHLNKLER